MLTRKIGTKMISKIEGQIQFKRRFLNVQQVKKRLLNNCTNAKLRFKKRLRKELIEITRKKLWFHQY